jgi:hypothetical protein
VRRRRELPLGEIIAAVQRETRFSADQIMDMDDDQLLFWYSGGKLSARPENKNDGMMSVTLKEGKSFAEQIEAIKQAAAEREGVTSGQDR